MNDMSGDKKIARVLGLYTGLVNGRLINKAEEAKRYGVNLRTIQRDIDDIRDYLEEDMVDTGEANSIVYDRMRKGYRLEHIYKMKLTNSEVLAISKILLDSRAFTKKEMHDIIDRFVSCCIPLSEKKAVNDLLRNEKFHYVEPRHRKIFIDKMWDIGIAIREHRYIEIEYARIKGKAVVKRKLKPAAIIFSEFYFYLTAFIEDEKIRKDFEILNDSSPTIYRIDRIKKLTVLGERFHVPYANRFEEGEFRKRIQFMFGGKLQKVKFRYHGTDIDSVLDKLPTAKILSEENGVYTVSAEVFGRGIDIWIRSQGDNVERIE